MKLFIASHSLESARKLQNDLSALGHFVTSRWIWTDLKFEHGLASYSDEERLRIAIMDEEDVRAASDGLVLISEPEGRTVPGGKHVETGMAIALNRPVFVIGRRENIFHWHPLARVFDSKDAFLAWLQS